MIAADDVGVMLDEQELLAPVSFTVEAGESLAVVGSNGSGKTTLLRVLAGLAFPSSGSVTVGNHRVDERDRRFRAGVAALIGVPPVARNLTLREHLTLVSASWGAETPAASEEADRLLTEFGIERLASRFPHELSSGQSQLFSLALILARPFEVLLLDEPEQRLDSDRLDLVSGLLRNLVATGVTVVFASHNAALVDSVADKTLLLGERDHARGH